tara:strand:- start:200 stop:712 length:513 start_codon:yes stop_codon:yes gene_type:complete
MEYTESEKKEVFEELIKINEEIKCKSKLLKEAYDVFNRVKLSRFIKASSSLCNLSTNKTSIKFGENISRFDILGIITNYINEHNLLDNNDNRIVIPDSKLSKILKVSNKKLIHVNIFKRINLDYINNEYMIENAIRTIDIKLSPYITHKLYKPGGMRYDGIKNNFDKLKK